MSKISIFQQAIKKIKLHIFDTWGWADNCYKMLPINNFLNGQMPPGCPLVPEGELIPLLMPRDPANDIHCVIFITPLTSVDDEQAIGELKKNVSVCVKHDLVPLIVVTRIDDIENAAVNKQLQDEITQKVAQNAQIFFHKNYTKEETRDVRIDLSTRKILSAVYKRGVTYFRKHEDNYEGVVWKCETILTDKKSHKPPNSPSTPTPGKETQVPSNNEPRTVQLCFKGKTANFSVKADETFSALLERSPVKAKAKDYRLADKNGCIHAEDEKILATYAETKGTIVLSIVDNQSWGEEEVWA